MRIVIDMQGAQTESRFRGIGRYTLSFALAVARYKAEHEIYLVLNGLMTNTIEPIRVAFDGLLPQENIKVWYAPGPVSAMEMRNDSKRCAAELIREAFIMQLQPDIVHVSSLFEGYLDDAAVSLKQYDKTSCISVSFYDLIPYLNPEQYLTPQPLYANYYLNKISQLKQIDIGLAISGHARQEALDHLPELANKMVNVSTAVGDEFKPMAVDEAQAHALFQEIGIERPFVLYTGGADERKNMPRLLQAYTQLPYSTRQKCQLVLAGKFSPSTVIEIKSQAMSLGLKSEELILTGYISDKVLIQLYNLCRLFVFPSWQEGFGLPALEAMSCGAVVIGSNTSSLPEVIGLESAMFDPFKVESIAAKMQQALHDEVFRADMRANGLKQAQKFSWDGVAQTALEAWTQILKHKQQANEPQHAGKPRLAFVSPMPPERTGIADYSAQLLPALAQHYDIELIVAQPVADLVQSEGSFPVRDVNWFLENSKEYDRVLYQFGNSPFHQHMLDLLQEIPGTVVLHDFYLSSLMSWLESQSGHANIWKQSLLKDHGYLALLDMAKDAMLALKKYPVNGDVLRHAQGLIVHSHHSRQLIENWYGAEQAQRAQVVPLLRTTPKNTKAKEARQALGLASDDFVVCSFGFLDATKLNDRLLSAWLQSSLSAHPNSQLIFVGENEGGEYGKALRQTIDKSGRSGQIRITGFVSADQYQQYLVCADVAVQLRSSSRGETSAAALDVLNYGVAMIANAHGALAELDTHAVCMLADDFALDDLTDSLQGLWQNPARRRELASRGQQYCQQQHSAVVCADAYAKAIELAQAQRPFCLSHLVESIAAKLPVNTEESTLDALAQMVDVVFPVKRLAKRIFLDVTATRSADRKSGIERATRALMLSFLNNTPKGYLTEPVYLHVQGEQSLYRHAHDYTLQLLQFADVSIEEEPISPQQGDVLIVLDLSGMDLVRAQQSGLFDQYRQMGVAVYAVVYDLLPVQMPNVFPSGADQSHVAWLHAISSFDGALAISKAVQNDLVQWQAEHGIFQQPRRPFKVNWFHLGSDMSSSAPTQGLPSDAEHLLSRLASAPTFLMVGTIEPRKAHLQVLEAFTKLWTRGLDIHLVIVGREGWKDVESSERRDIPQVMNILQQHPEKQKHLHWLDGISDEYLEKVYTSSSCLLAASWGEGFGLPLIEAAHHNLPILARDIPIFREVAGPHASYFNATDAEGLSVAVQEWLKRGPKHVPQSFGMTTQTWQQSVQQLVTAVLP
jgi:glycosyltransferase involved in cell wall biosynthesis